MHQAELVDLTAATRDELWARILNRTHAESFLELGVFRGAFAEKILWNCPAVSKYYMLDPWRHLEDWNKPSNVSEDIFASYFREAMERTAFAADRRIVLRGTTAERVDEIPDGSLDVAYIDGDHTLRGITIDIQRIFRKIKPGGLLAGDDFARSIWQHSTKFEPTFVFPYAVYFAEAISCPIVALPFNQFAIVCDQSGFSFTDNRNIYKDVPVLPHVTMSRIIRRKVAGMFHPLRKRIRRRAGV